jgi:hypothetical protein
MADRRGAVASQDTEKLEVLGEIGGKRSSAAEAGVDSVRLMRGLKSPPPSRSSFFAGCYAPQSVVRCSIYCAPADGYFVQAWHFRVLMHPAPPEFSIYNCGTRPSPGHTGRRRRVARRHVDAAGKVMRTGTATVFAALSTEAVPRHAPGKNAMPPGGSPWHAKREPNRRSSLPRRARSHQAVLCSRGAAQQPRERKPGRGAA